MNRSKLQTFLLAFCSALAVNALLFSGIALLSRENPPQGQMMTVSSPIRLAAGRFSFPGRSAATEPPRSGLPEAAPDLQEVPQPPTPRAPAPAPQPVTTAAVPASRPAAPPRPTAKPRITKHRKPHKPHKSRKPRKPPKQPSQRMRGKPHAENSNAPTKPTPASTLTSVMPTHSAGSHSPSGAHLASGKTSDCREFSLGEVDRAPRILQRQNPTYPLMARRRKLSGKVTVKFLVDRDGKVRKPEILEAHPSGVFEQTVLESITKWSFKPAVYHGNKVATWVVLPIQFRLRGG